MEIWSGEIGGCYMWPPSIPPLSSCRSEFAEKTKVEEMRERREAGFLPVAAAEYFFCVGKPLQTKQYSTIPVRWHKPAEGWFKLNSDGASIGNLGNAGAGGLIRDHSGNWIKGYMRNIGVATSIIAEFWALRDGLLLASQLGINHLIIELDAKVIVDLMLSNNTCNKAYMPLLNDCSFGLRHCPPSVVDVIVKEAGLFV
ncbi:uncharacterized protein LOC142633081 [Castanea sativa]|uniref:uncharacterized protein LOC142633081 n=1 Tax=Castanea sativa TaxID=21020 RepID=UPI003F6535D3